MRILGSMTLDQLLAMSPSGLNLIDQSLNDLRSALAPNGL